jgi:dUTP pyrophosphatase
MSHSPDNFHDFIEAMFREGGPIVPTVAVMKLAHFPSEHIEDAALLQPAHDGDAGVDLYAADDLVIAPGQRILARTGISIAVPQGFEAQVRPRSGNALKLGLTVLNTPGTIDAGYRGEVGVILFNSQPSVLQTNIDLLLDAIEGMVESPAVQEAFDLSFSQSTVRIKRGERIAQIVFARFERPTVVLTDTLPVSRRGQDGFGSTGTIGTAQ